LEVKVKKNILAIILAFVMVVSFSGVSWAMAGRPDTIEIIDQKAKVFSLEDNLGGKVDVAEFIGKKPVIFFFWTTWCPHCRQQIKHLKEEETNIRQAGIELILVDIDESREQVSRFLRTSGGAFTSLLDPDAKIAEMYMIVGVPTFIVVGEDGIIRFHDNLFPGNYRKIILQK